MPRKLVHIGKACAWIDDPHHLTNLCSAKGHQFNNQQAFIHEASNALKIALHYAGTFPVPAGQLPLARHFGKPHHSPTNDGWPRRRGPVSSGKNPRVPVLLDVVHEPDDIDDAQNSLSLLEAAMAEVAGWPNPAELGLPEDSTPSPEVLALWESATENAIEVLAAIDLARDHAENSGHRDAENSGHRDAGSSGHRAEVVRMIFSLAQQADPQQFCRMHIVLSAIECPMPADSGQASDDVLSLIYSIAVQYSVDRHGPGVWL